MMENTGSLLDEYQYDDEETIDLLNAIKNWNLKRPPNSPAASTSMSVSLSSTIGTASEFDTITAVSTNTSKGGFTVSSAIKLTPKTPMSNYSSKPSSLTARILQDVFPPASTAISTTAMSTTTSSVPNSNENARFNDENKAPKNFTVTDTGTDTVTDTVTDGTKLHPLATNNSKTRLSQPPRYVTTTQKQTHDDHTDALEILRKTAAELGLSNDQLGAVLPTVQKLVKVITQHVPRLEHFVKEVCDVVMDDKHPNPTQEIFSTPPPPRGKQEKKKNRKNMDARKERMDSAVSTLRKHWDSNHAGRGDALVLQEVDGNRKDDETCDAEQKLSLDYHDYHSYGIFTTAVKERLSTQRQSSFVEVKTPVASNKDHVLAIHSQFLTDTEALKEINRLIEFEEKYSERVNGMIHSGGSDSSALASATSPPQSDTVLRDLLNADTTTLRRFVLHFAYLFTVRQEHILEKMNDLYVFSHEATSLIHDVKKAMGVSPHCPIHSVARQVVAMIEHSQST